MGEGLVRRLSWGDGYLVGCRKGRAKLLRKYHSKLLELGEEKAPISGRE